MVRVFDIVEFWILTNTFGSFTYWFTANCFWKSMYSCKWPQLNILMDHLAHTILHNIHHNILCSHCFHSTKKKIIAKKTMILLFGWIIHNFFVAHGIRSVYFLQFLLLINLHETSSMQCTNCSCLKQTILFQ